MNTITMLLQIYFALLNFDFLRNSNTEPMTVNKIANVGVFLCASPVLGNTFTDLEFAFLCIDVDT